MEITRVTGNTYYIDTGMTYLPFYKLNQQDVILMDSGWPGELAEIQKLLDENNLKVAAIIVSHVHPDHAGNNAYFKDKYGCIIAMPRDEAILCSSLYNLKIYFNTQIMTMSSIKKHYGYMVCETDIFISKEQTSVNICGQEFGLFHTPGHSSAQICIITPDDVAYLADSLISTEIMKGSKIPFSFVLKDDLESKSSLHTLRVGHYIVAHKGVYDDISQLIEENIRFYNDRAESIFNLIEGAMTAEDILKSAVKNFGIRIESAFKYDVIFRMLRCYVEYLADIGRIKLFIENGFLKYAKA